MTNRSMMDHQARYQDSSNARFTEHLSSSPPYHQYYHDQSPEVAEYDGGSTGLMGSPPMSDKDRHTSAEMSSPGLQSVLDEEGQKEVVPPRNKQGSHPGLVPGLLGFKSDDDKSRRRYCGLSRSWFIILSVLLVLVVLAIALGVGLGVGLSNNHSSSGSSTSSPSPQNEEYLIGGAINPAYYSQTGAFNGSGIAFASQAFIDDPDAGTQYVIYFQHHTGEIRYVQLSAVGQWEGGTLSEVVAVNAKNNTPLSAVAYSVQGVDSWHVFYIDDDNILRQRSNSNTTNVWADGPINDLNLKVWDADQIGMQACWYGNDYGDSDYSHTPLPGQNTSNGNPALSNQIGMHMWYASDANTFQQLGWRDGDASWQHQNVFNNMNGHCGVGCYSWGPGTVTYAMFVNEQNAVEFYWKDTNTNLTSTAAHPINTWVKASPQIQNVNPATSLGYTNYFYAQMQDDTIHGFNLTWAAENTTIQAGSEFVVGSQPGISGTHMSVSALPNPGGSNSIVVFYQIEGSDITEYTRDLIVGQWSSVNLPIPNQ